MFWRRYLFGQIPLLVWAETEEAADITAMIHASTLIPDSLKTSSWLPFDGPDAAA